MGSTQTDEYIGKSPQSALERKYIEEYLTMKGYQWRDLVNLPEEEAKNLMIGACRYTSSKLAEMESRASFRQKIHFE